MVSVIIVNYLFYVLGHICCTSYIATYVVLAVMQNCQKFPPVQMECKVCDDRASGCHFSAKL